MVANSTLPESIRVAVVETLNPVPVPPFVPLLFAFEYSLPGERIGDNVSNLVKKALVAV